MQKVISAFAIVLTGAILVLGGCNMSGSVAARIAFEGREDTSP